MPLTAKKLAQSLAKSVSINDLNHILLKRKNGDSIPALHPRDQFTIFAMIDKFLGGDGLLLEKSRFWEEDSSITPVTNDQKFEEMLISVDPMDADRREKWSIIVFSETFFSDVSGDDEEVEQFLRLCRLLTSKYQKLIISVNFLHKYEGRSRTYSRNTPKGNDYIVSKNVDGLRRNKSSNLRFSNCTLILWNGVPLSCYRKTTYKEEGDDLISAESESRLGYGYDFGDWKSYPTPELQTASDFHQEIAKLFNSGKEQIVAARTCYDMNRTSKLSNKIKLLILTADGSPEFPSWIAKTKNVVSCVRDSDRGGFLVIGNNGEISTQITISPLVFNELHCIVYKYYGEIRDEMVDVGCCGCCC